jgi:hypothetical protein
MGHVMRLSSSALVAVGLSSAVLLVACSEELNPATAREKPSDAGAADGFVDDATAGRLDDLSTNGYPCSAILECVEGCRTAECPNECMKAASPKAKEIVGQWQVCLDDAAKSATCNPYCAPVDGGADAGDGSACFLCALAVCKSHRDACVADQ